MKSLKSKLIPLVAGGLMLVSSFLPHPALAEEQQRKTNVGSLAQLSNPEKEEQKEEFFFKPYAAAGGGCYIWANKPFQDMYGITPRVRGRIGAEISKNARFELAASYSSKDGTPYTTKNLDPTDYVINMTTIQIEALAHYLIPSEDFVFYVGGGLTAIRLKESIAYANEPKNNKIVEKTVGGPVLNLGLDIPLNKEKTINLYLDSSATIFKSPPSTGAMIGIVPIFTLEAGLIFK